MSEREATPPIPGEVPDQMFPTLTPAQLKRIASQGTVRQVPSGETLVEANAQGNKFFVVIAGQLNVLRASGNTEEVVAVFAPGTLTCGLNMLSARRGLLGVRACKPGAVIQIVRGQLV